MGRGYIRENTPASGISLKQLDREEILRTVRLGIEAGRLPESTGGDSGDMLDRLRLRENGQLLNAAVILFGKESLPGYPQRQLRLARFRSRLRNPFIAEVFYRRGLIEQWGQGTPKMNDGLLGIVHHRQVKDSRG